MGKQKCNNEFHHKALRYTILTMYVTVIILVWCSCWEAGVVVDQGILFTAMYRHSRNKVRFHWVLMCEIQNCPCSLWNSNCPWLKCFLEYNYILSEMGWDMVWLIMHYQLWFYEQFSSSGPLNLYTLLPSLFACWEMSLIYSCSTNVIIYQCSKLIQKSCQSSCLESQIINIELRKIFKTVPGPPPKLSASGRRTGSNLECCIYSKYCHIFAYWGNYFILQWTQKASHMEPSSKTVLKISLIGPWGIWKQLIAFIKLP